MIKCNVCSSSLMIYEFSTADSRVDLCEFCGALTKDKPAVFSINPTLLLDDIVSSAIFKYFINVTNKLNVEDVENLAVIANFNIINRIQEDLDISHQISEPELCSVIAFKFNACNKSISVVSIDSFNEFNSILFYKSLGLLLDQSHNGIHKILNNIRVDAEVIFIEPTIDSILARMLGSFWPHFYSNSRTFFNNQSLKTWAYRSGFQCIKIVDYESTIKISNIINLIGNQPKGSILHLLHRFLTLTTPGFLKSLTVKAKLNNICYKTKFCKSSLPSKLSVIIPVYNEVATIDLAIERVLNKKIDGLTKEIVIVESNSNDGTREALQKYKELDDVKIVLQDMPRGKGFAVREGFKSCTGDLILIQDGDDEYDIDDYDALLRPLVDCRHDFVLGARHGGKAWKMRSFDGQKHLSQFLNFGHILFAGLVNFLFGLHLKDPFTMYKVFRRDSICDLHFQCNRFDFDYELLIKLYKSGCVPVEIPVNYRSRGFKDGKKVRIIYDPILWIIALIRLRFNNDNS